MPSGKKRISKTTQDERRREIKAIYATASNATKHFINKEGAFVTSIPLGTEEIRRLARLEHSLKKRKVTPGRAIRILAGLSPPETARGLLSEDHLAQRWLCSKSRLQKWRAERSKIAAKALRCNDLDLLRGSENLQSCPKSF